MKKQKKLRLHRETLHDLRQKALEAAQGGLTRSCRSECTFCVECISDPPPPAA